MLHFFGFFWSLFSLFQVSFSVCLSLFLSFVFLFSFFFSFSLVFFSFVSFIVFHCQSQPSLELWGNVLTLRHSCCCCCTIRSNEIHRRKCNKAIKRLKTRAIERVENKVSEQHNRQRKRKKECRYRAIINENRQNEKKLYYCG